MKLKLTFSWMLEGYIFLFESNEFFFSYWKIFSLFLQRFQRFYFLVWKFPDLRRFTDLRVERILGERKKILNAQKRNSKTGTRIKIVKYSRNGVVRKRKKKCSICGNANTSRWPKPNERSSLNFCTKKQYRHHRTIRLDPGTIDISHWDSSKGREKKKIRERIR